MLKRKVFLVNKDEESEMVRCSALSLRTSTKSQLYRPPLAIPVKMYGVKKTTSALCQAAREAVINMLKEKSA